MSNDFWLKKWQDQNIPFHQQDINLHLMRYFPDLKIPPGNTIFVPLCGKSSDMLWLINAGYQVIGIELSELACQQFFSENKISVEISEQGAFKIFIAEHIKIYCGDFFALTPNEIPPLAGIYDRAAFIALDQSTRKKYAEHLLKLITSQTQVLLITLESNNFIEGPPYSISHTEIENLFGDELNINIFKRKAVDDIADHLREKGYVEMMQTVYQLQRKK